MTPGPDKPGRVEELPFEVTYAPRPDAPPLRWAISSTAAERRYWRWFRIVDPVLGAAKFAAAPVVAALPPGWASAIGAAFAPVARWAHEREPFARRIRDHLRDPGLGSADQSDPDKVRRWWTNTARLYAEFPRIGAIVDTQARDAAFRARLSELSAAHPNILFVSVHVGQWEALFALLDRCLDRRVIGPYQPEPSRFSNRLIERARRRRAQYAFPPGQRSAIYLSRFLRNKSAVGFFMIDEVHDGWVRFPLFGRPVPHATNAARAVRLAMRSDAVLVPVAMPRLSGSRFQVALFDPVEIAQGGDDRARIRATIAQLNDVFEPLVRAHLDQWFMLPNLDLSRAKDRARRT